MTRSEAYAEGFHEGRRWAEEDISAHSGRNEPCPQNVDVDGPRRATHSLIRAQQAGKRRGYRDTWARWEAGTLSWEEFEHAPLNRDA